MSEIEKFTSPYLYWRNNPIIFVDPDGEAATLIVGGVKVGIEAVVVAVPVIIAVSEDAKGWRGKDHYHRFNPKKTGSSDKFLDKNGDPVPDNSKDSHIKPKDMKEVF